MDLGQQRRIATTELTDELERLLRSSGYNPNNHLVGEVSRTVISTFEESLGVDPEELSPFAKLSKDLGAESIDYLDFTFHLEQGLGIKIEHGRGLDGVGYEHTAGNGIVDDEGMARIRNDFPMLLAGMESADRAEFEKGRKLSDYNRSLTVLGTAGHVYTIAAKQRSGERVSA